MIGLQDCRLVHNSWQPMTQRRTRMISCNWTCLCLFLHGCTHQIHGTRSLAWIWLGDQRQAQPWLHHHPLISLFMLLQLLVWEGGREVAFPTGHLFPYCSAASQRDFRGVTTCWSFTSNSAAQTRCISTVRDYSVSVLLMNTVDSPCSLGANSLSHQFHHFLVQLMTRVSLLECQSSCEVFLIAFSSPIFHQVSFLGPCSKNMSFCSWIVCRDNGRANLQLFTNY